MVTFTIPLKDSHLGTVPNAFAKFTAAGAVHFVPGGGGGGGGDFTNLTTFVAFRVVMDKLKTHIKMFHRRGELEESISRR